ncbi:energy transducer TonB [uncultured Bdellovibrio sp.]|uniref:energy transducer TonB n=1 Tax=Bdellovibrio sp. HCB-162 TaxID=3394234 RepID=UPI0025CF2BB3|nr:energy transducer TonB [uncultured Bdellovibrio sp.]
MKLPRNSLNINKTILLSALLHGGAFVLGLSLAAPEIVPLPVGVELMYGDGGQEQAPKIEAAKPVKIKTAVVADDSDAPALKNEKVETTQEPQQASTGKTMGSVAGTSEKGALEGREGVANGTEVSPEERYLYEIKKLLERRKRYPVMAKKMGHTGKVTMRFTLAADGSLQESEVVEKTPYDSLNKAAHELVKGIDKMKPFPQEIQKTSWVITVPIEYSLN